jgi:hypothetical protein
MKTLDPPIAAVDIDPSGEGRGVLNAVPDQEQCQCCGKAT